MYCYGCLYNVYTWKNQVYLSMIILICELWVVWSSWICWESGFVCAICGHLSVCCLSSLCLACYLFWLVVVFCMSVCKQTTYFNCRWLTSRLTLKFMLGDVLWRTQPLNMWVGLYIHWQRLTLTSWVSLKFEIYAI